MPDYDVRGGRDDAGVGSVFASNSIIGSDCGKDVFYILVICFPDCCSMCPVIEIRANPFFLFLSLTLFSL